MSITSLTGAMWPAILKLQHEAYAQVGPESLDVLKSKWLRSPDSCFVYRDGERLMGYLLAHAWGGESPPSLFKPLPERSENSYLFLHDLVVSQNAAGQGIGSAMTAHLINTAALLGCRHIRLVSIQYSNRFWQKMGFTPMATAVCSSYGLGAQLMQMDI
ncbi:GNAT family N-acetyltransferase [Oceanimonas sp. MB9]|uniref:GNAT family N-acetyltransferase n=1 Tax=Oceanimonas sp. MB9 TaxID=2588453 RepID=UPI0013F68F58|nr:GNAT family N-acetyltransferase [Oceanimonas sp. MB9]NHI00519.1 hypothetical protein [Oceanimonas sp. MB9]